MSRNVCLAGDGALYCRNLVLCEDSCEEMQLQNIDLRRLILTRFLLLFPERLCLYRETVLVLHEVSNILISKLQYAAESLTLGSYHLLTKAFEVWSHTLFPPTYSNETVKWKALDDGGSWLALMFWFSSPTIY